MVRRTEATHRVLLGLGSNLGDREGNLREAVARLDQLDGVRWEQLSSLRETEPVGGPPQGKFLNAAGELTTSLSPERLLAELLRLEAELGRVRTVRNAPRTIDLDMLTYDDLVLNAPGLVLPHPRMTERAFVLEPLVEIAPLRVHPVSGRTFRELLGALRAGTDPVATPPADRQNSGAAR